MPSKAQEILANNDEYGAYTGLGLPLTLLALRRGNDSLSETERQFLGVYQLHTNVNNGGFYCYFTNSSGDLAAEALAGLERIGALHVRSLLSRACSIFPNGIVPKTQVEREVFLQDRSSDWKDLLESLNDEFYASNDKLSNLAVTFASEHIDDFCLE